jgi:hypothetical protein
MGFQANKFRRLWLPFAILAVIVLIVGWILAGVVYPKNVQGDDQSLATSDLPTLSASPTEIPTSTLTPIASPTVDASITSATPSGSCTYSINYWRTHPDAWLIENIILGNLSYTKAEAIDILNLEHPNPTERLLGEFFTALLNSLNGADSTEIDAIMIAARDWLILHPLAIDLTEAEILEAETYTGQLQAFNIGLSGPGPCSDEPVTPTPSVTFTPQATETNTPAFPVPSSSPTPTKSSGGRPKPTSTSPPAGPTNTPLPKPTNAPIPTPTSVSPPTEVPTLTPPTPPPTQGP